MTIQDLVFGSLCIWRENRGGGLDGMHSVLNVIENESRRLNISVYEEVTRHGRYSSMTIHGDAETVLFASKFDAMWIDAQALINRLDAGDLPDITNGATEYYAPHGLTEEEKSETPIVINGVSYPFPKTWNRDVLVFTIEISNQLFFRNA